MRSMTLNLHRNRQGQSLLETALLLPLLLVLVFNAVNLGYFFYAYLNLTTGPRQGAQYSILGGATTNNTMPTSDQVNALLMNDITGAMPAASNTPTRVCVFNNGLDNAGTTNQTPTCVGYGNAGGSFTAIQPDPEAPQLVLHRVDIQYTVNPLIGGFAFNLVTGNSLTLHRTIYMRMEQ